MLPGSAPIDGGVGDQDPHTTRRGVEPTWFIHEPRSQCPRCHGETRKRNFSAQVRLTTPVPQLCFGCHRAPSSEDGWVHGPVAAGRCVVCHEPHRSLNPGLLKKPVPQICLQCHTQLSSIEHHEEPLYSQCLDCHAGHASGARHLLKAGLVDREGLSTRSEPTGDVELDALLAGARRDLRGVVDMEEVLNLAAAYLQQGEIKKARAQLMAVRMDRSLSETDRRRVSELEKSIGASEQERRLKQQEARQERASRIARLYFQSVNAYHDGRLEQAYVGFTEVLGSDVLPKVIEEAVRSYMDDIRRRMGRTESGR